MFVDVLYVTIQNFTKEQHCGFISFLSFCVCSCPWSKWYLTPARDRARERERERETLWGNNVQNGGSWAVTACTQKCVRRSRRRKGRRRRRERSRREEEEEEECICLAWPRPGLGLGFRV